MLHTITQVRNAHEGITHGHFFDAESLRFFGSEIGRKVYPTPSGAVFVTSEQDTSCGSEYPPAWDGQRRYTVRYCSDTGEIRSRSEFGQYSSREAAHRAAERHASKVTHPAYSNISETDVPF